MSNTLDTTTLLADAKIHRLVLQATFVPVTGDLFQPAGFPDIGHVIYDAPRPIMEEKGEGKDKQPVQAKDALGNPQWSKEKVCIVDSAASMANHLEAAMHADRKARTLDLHSDLEGMPYVQCLTDGPETAKDKKPTRLVLTTLSEAHRLASTYFLEGFTLNADGKFESQKKTVKRKENGVDVEKEEDVISSRVFGEVLRKSFGVEDLGKKTHPLPGDWWNVFRTIFRYDPNSLVHGILFPAMGIKLSRVLTVHHEAFGADRVGFSGVKFDKLEKTDSRQSIFANDRETAREIRATFVIDLSLIRSFGCGEQGLNDDQKRFLLELALWKIQRLLAEPYAFRSGCDLKCLKLVRVGDANSPAISVPDLGSGLKALISKGDKGEEADNRSIWLKPDEKDKSKTVIPISDRITKVYWPSEKLFKPARDEEDKGKKGMENEDEESDANSNAGE
jgi:CRISPR-associated protein Csb1